MDPLECLESLVASITVMYSKCVEMTYSFGLSGGA